MKVKQCVVVKISTKERCHAKFLEGHLNELCLLIGPNKSGRFFICLGQSGSLVYSKVPLLMIVGSA